MDIGAVVLGEDLAGVIFGLCADLQIAVALVVTLQLATDAFALALLEISVLE